MPSKAVAFTAIDSNCLVSVAVRLDVSWRRSVLSTGVSVGKHLLLDIGRLGHVKGSGGGCWVKARWIFTCDSGLRRRKRARVHAWRLVADGFEVKGPSEDSGSGGCGDRSLCGVDFQVTLGRF